MNKKCLVFLLTIIYCLNSWALNIVTSNLPFSHLVAGLTSTKDSIHSLVPAGASPHSFSLRPSDIRMLNQADLIIWGGADSEPFLAHTITQLSKPSIIDISQIKSLTRLKNRAEHDHGHHHHHHAHEYDPHVWLDLDNASQLLAVFHQQLGTISSKEKLQHRQQQLQQLKTSIKKQLHTKQQTAFVVFHDAYQYFENMAGLQQIKAISLNPSQPISAKRLQEITQYLEQHQVACLFTEPQFSPKLITRLQQATQIPTHALDPLGNHPDVSFNNYLQLITALADAFATCGA